MKTFMPIHEQDGEQIQLEALHEKYLKCLDLINSRREQALTSVYEIFLERPEILEYILLWESSFKWMSDIMKIVDTRGERKKWEDTFKKKEGK